MQGASTQQFVKISTLAHSKLSRDFMKIRIPLTILSSRRLNGVLAALALAAILAPVASFAESDEIAPLNTAKNLARMNCGAQIEWNAPDGRTARGQRESAAALIMDDDTVSCPLPEGQTEFVIKLPATASLDRFTFVNENAEAAGQLKISVSNYRLPAVSPKWVEVEGAIAFTRKRVFNLSLVGVEARYVKLSFQVEKAGRIASLGLYGGETLQRFAWRQEQIRPSASWVANIGSTRHTSMEDRLNFNFANLYARAHVVYVSSGSLASAGRMIDDDTDTGFHFAASDRQPTVVVELAENEQLHRVSTLYQLKAAGRLDFYLLNDLSQEALHLDNQKPIASVTDEDGQGKAAIDFDPRGARYVALRWTSAEAAHAAQGFEIAEIDAFGNMPLAMLSLTDAPDLVASSFTAVQVPGERGPDVSNGLGTLAIPPLLPLLSP